MAHYRSAPLPSKNIPGGIPYIIANEAAERFSFYGMRVILVVFMTQYLLNPAGTTDVMNDEEAKAWFHLFVSAVYFTPVLGALLSDGVLGKYKTIILLSIVYCIGHFALAIDHTRMGLAIGLGLIAIGSGGIKPCVSAHLGDQFGKTNQPLLSKVFGWFYFAINFGAFISMLATPWLMDSFGPSVAFTIPGILMLVATLVFWMGRNKFVHIPPAGKSLIKEVFSKAGIKPLAKLCVIYIFIAVFWALYDQTGSAWVLQAKLMDRHIFGIEILPSQIQATNALLVMLLIPLFAYVIYPALEKRINLTPLRKISIGLFLTVFAFSISTMAQYLIDSGSTPHIMWQIIAYVILTSAEVMVSITCLEFSYTQAPKAMKSFVMAFFMMSISIGNLFTSAVNYIIQNDDGTSKLTGTEYYIFFTSLMLVTSFLFLLVVKYYRGETYLQEESH